MAAPATQISTVPTGTVLVRYDHPCGREYETRIPVLDALPALNQSLHNQEWRWFGPIPNLVSTEGIVSYGGIGNTIGNVPEHNRPDIRYVHLTFDQGSIWHAQTISAGREIPNDHSKLPTGMVRRVRCVYLQDQGWYVALTTPDNDPVALHIALSHPALIDQLAHQEKAYLLREQKIARKWKRIQIMQASAQKAAKQNFRAGAEYWLAVRDSQGRCGLAPMSRFHIFNTQSGMMEAIGSSDEPLRHSLNWWVDDKGRPWMSFFNEDPIGMPLEVHKPQWLPVPVRLEGKVLFGVYKTRRAALKLLRKK